MGHFLSDLERSRNAVNLLMKRYEANGYTVREFVTREEQKCGDFQYTLAGESVDVEVKFDEMAAKTGNLCFEMSNGSKMTGIMATPATRIIYVVPGKGDIYMAFVFNTEKLRAFIQNSANVVVKKGGDKWRFVLALAKITKVIEADLPEEVFEIA